MLSDDEFNSYLLNLVKQQRETLQGERDVVQMVFALHRDKETINAVVGGPSDPIEGLQAFGQTLSQQQDSPVEAIFVVSETVRNEVVIAGATPDGRLNAAYLETRRTRFRKRIQFTGERIHPHGADKAFHFHRHPAAAVLIGMGQFDVSKFEA